METSLSLDGDAEEPSFDQRFEFRDFAYDPRSKFVIYVSWFSVYFLWLIKCVTMTTRYYEMSFFVSYFSF